ncbi:hypothetical protein PRIPAC_95115 [Pristionchus pacificus]|uniref:Uncharacterized protein n=1 Tax=Pristionchus pacificus TaxID=54126 RepID=A0A454Y788_PRIPA|nr:hypothetical protein PRIPAC_95115 [Pristionchus pacificus]|eukprot:PDM63037.1 hypothetical protein PRIPAC_50252 [Pristionchus pacificus]
MDEAMVILNRHIKDAQEERLEIKEEFFSNDVFVVNDCSYLAKQLGRLGAVIRRGHVSKVQILGVILALNDATERMEKTGEIKASKGVVNSMRCLVNAPGIEVLMREVNDDMVEIGLVGEDNDDDFIVDTQNDDEDMTFDNVINQVYDLIKNDLSNLKNEVLKYF